MSANGNDHALSDVTNKLANTQFDEAALDRVKKANWVAPPRFDYAKYNESPRDKTVPASESERLEGPSDWAGSAVKYEFKEEFGDVGPDDEVLKKILFGDEHQVKQGEEFSRYVIPFTSQGWLA